MARTFNYCRSHEGMIPRLIAAQQADKHARNELNRQLGSKAGKRPALQSLDYDILRRGSILGNLTTYSGPPRFQPGGGMLRLPVPCACVIYRVAR